MERKAILFTGRWDTASSDKQRELFEIFDEDRIAEDYPLYFYWFNVLHEIGHVLMRIYADRKYPPYREETVVTDFAAAYWRTCGEPDKFTRLNELVAKILPRFPNPDTNGDGFLEYARLHWESREFRTFRQYGWFQFHCTASSLARPLTLPEAFENMGITGRTLCALPVRTYDLHQPDVALSVARDAIQLLCETYQLTFPREWEHRLVDDPNRHGVMVARI